MGSSAQVEGLDFDDSRDSLSIRIEKKAEYVSTDAIWWLDVIVGICGGVLLMASIFQSSRQPGHRMGEEVLEI